MNGHAGAPMCRRVVSDLVATFDLAIRLKADLAQPCNHLTIGKLRKVGHVNVDSNATICLV
jgi:hypothetical protein